MAWVQPGAEVVFHDCSGDYGDPFVISWSVIKPLFHYHESVFINHGMEGRCCRSSAVVWSVQLCLWLTSFSIVPVTASTFCIVTSGNKLGVLRTVQGIAWDGLILIDRFSSGKLVCNGCMSVLRIAFLINPSFYYVLCT